MSFSTATLITTTSSQKQTTPIPPVYLYEITETYQTVADSVNETPMGAEQAPGIPLMGNGHPVTPGRIVNSIVAERDKKTDTVFVVTVGYSSNASNNTASTDPLSTPPEFSWDFEESREPRSKDGQNNPIVNSAGDSFDPPPEFEFADPVLTITRNQASYNEPQAIQYANAVNTDYFHGGQPGEAKMRPISASQQFQNGVHYWRVTYKIVFRKNWDDGTSGWTRLFLDEGLRGFGDSASTLSGHTTPLDNLKTDTGQRATAPMKLDGNGAKLATGADPEFRFIPPWKALPFSVFGLP